MAVLFEQTGLLCWIFSVVLILRWLHVSRTTDVWDEACSEASDSNPAHTE